MDNQVIRRLGQLYFSLPEDRRLDKINFSRLETDQLDDLSPAGIRNYAYKEELYKLLDSIPKQWIAREFSPEVILHLWIEHPEVYVTDDDLKGVIPTLTEERISLVKKARNTTWELVHKIDSELVLRTYDFFEQTTEEQISGLNLPLLLQYYAKNSISNSKLKEYELHLVRTKNNFSYGWEQTWASGVSAKGNYFEIYLDAPLGIALMYQGEPNAVIAFYPSDEETLFIPQIQGIQPAKMENGEQIGKGHSRGLAPLYWQELLIESVEQIAEQQEFISMAIQGGQNNYWIRKNQITGKEHITLEQALLKYDGLAERLKFEQSGDKNWYRSIKRER